MRHVVVFWMSPNTSAYTSTQSTLLIKMSRATLKAQIDHRGGDPHITWDPCINSQLQIHLFRTFSVWHIQNTKQNVTPTFFPGKHGSKQNTRQLGIEMNEINQPYIFKNVTKVRPYPNLFYMLHIHPNEISSQFISFLLSVLLIRVQLFLKPTFLTNRTKQIATENSLSKVIKDVNLNHWHLL